MVYLHRKSLAPSPNTSVCVGTVLVQSWSGYDNLGTSTNVSPLGIIQDLFP